MISPAPPRDEQGRVYKLIGTVPTFTNERTLIEQLTRQIIYWRDQTNLVLGETRRQNLDCAAENRLGQVLRAVGAALSRDDETKVIIFSAWPQTIIALQPHLNRLFLSTTIARFTVDLDEDYLQQSVNRFQADGSCRVLLCDELGGEGRNFQIASQIIHIDIPWTPAQLEQRIGRVDRLGRSGTVLSIIPFARGRLEHSLFRIWQEAFGLFTRSMSGLEIALEEIQGDLAETLAQSVRHGIEEMLPAMVLRATDLHAAVAEEQYFEEEATGKRFREQFSAISERYRSGELLGKAVLAWADLAGLRSTYSAPTRMVTFNPRHFSCKSMENAKFSPPSMAHARRRSQNQNMPLLQGTFDRDIAVLREDLVFFAPGDDPWTDAIIGSAFEADRGRCCAIRRSIADLARPWYGFELLFSLQVNPRPLYAEGLDPTHLMNAQGFLMTPTLRLMIDIDGKVLRRSDPVWAATRRDFDKILDTHLGKRDGVNPPLGTFQERYPPDEWRSLVSSVISTAHEFFQEELDFTDDLASEAEAEFRRRLLGWESSHRWMANHSDLYRDEATVIEEYRRATVALVEGIRRPLLRLESACFWELVGKRG